MSDDVIKPFNLPHPHPHLPEKKKNNKISDVDPDSDAVCTTTTTTTNSSKLNQFLSRVTNTAKADPETRFYRRKRIRVTLPLDMTPVYHRSTSPAASPRTVLYSGTNCGSKDDKEYLPNIASETEQH